MSGTASTRSDQRSSDRGGFIAASIVFALATLLGGRTSVGVFSDEILEIICLPLLVVSLYRLLNRRPWCAGWLWPILIVAPALLLPLLQIVPVPPALWTSLPGRDAVVAVFDAVGLPIGWRPVSLAPHATVYAFLALIPPAALFFTVLQLDWDQRAKVLPAPLAVAALSAMVGLGQLFGKYGVFSGDVQGVFALGFFSNRNHFAALFYAALPLAAVWTFQQRRDARRPSQWNVLFGVAIVVFLLSGISISFSRAGAALGVVSVIGSAFIVWRSSTTSRLGRWPAIAAGIGLVGFAIILQFGLIELITQRSAADATRSAMARLTLEALGVHWLAGTGFGTFVPVFKSFERPSDVLLYYVNHAHNDWFEIVLEGGLAAAILLVAFVGWVVSRAWPLWFDRSGEWSSGRLFGVAASLSVLLLMAHSTLDYPLRTTTLACWFAVACAFLCTAPEPPRPRAAASRRHASDRPHGARTHVGSAMDGAR